MYANALKCLVPSMGSFCLKYQKVPWKLLCVDLVGLYTVMTKDSTKGKLNTMTFIDPATGWFKITTIPGRTLMQMLQVLNSTWLSRYPCLEAIIFDNGTDFLKGFRNVFND